MRAANALGQMLIPAPADVSVRFSRMVTSQPHQRRPIAVARPAIPAPTMTTRSLTLANLTRRHRVRRDVLRLAGDWGSSRCRQRRFIPKRPRHSRICCP